MKNKLFNILFIIFILFGCKAQDSNHLPLATKGVIDLRGFKEDTIKLNGEWEFFFGEFCNPDPSLRLQSCKSSTDTYIQFPGQWQKFGYPVDGYATYKLKILLQEGVNDDLALSISDAGSNYAMYINGNLFSQNGKVGKTKEESEVYLKYKNLDIPKEWTENGELELIIHVSNFHDVASGFWDTIKLGTQAEISKTAKQKNALDLIVFGFLFMMGLYHLGLYTIRKKDTSPLFLGMFCVLISLRIVSIGERIILDAFPDFPFFLARKIEFLSFYFGSYLFMRFVKSLFPDGFWKPLYYVLSIVPLVSSFLTILFPMKVYLSARTIVQLVSLLLILQLIYVLIFAIKRKLMGARLFLFGFIIFSSSVINDILKAQGILQTPFAASYGLLAFTFFQAIVLSRRFAFGMDSAEKLSEDLDKKSQSLEETTVELKHFTENLEVKVQERTQELELANKEIDKLNKIMKKINSVSDLTDILTFIMFHLEKDYKYNEFWMLLKEEESDELYTYAFVSPFTTPEKINILKQIKIPLTENSLILEAYNHKKVNQVFLEKDNLSEFEKNLKEIHNFSYYLSLPMVVYEAVTGILFIHSRNISSVSKVQIEKLQNFNNQIAGAISNSRLFKQAQLAREEAEKARNETEGLNELMRNINSVSSLVDIMSFIMYYLETEYNFSDFYLLLNEESEKKLIPFSFTSTRHKDEIREYFLSKEISHSDLQGVCREIFEKKEQFM